VIGKEIEFFKEKDVILFGCGSCGIRALEEFVKVGANILAFCDNNKDLIGKTLNGYGIISPENLKEYSDASILITSTYEEEIENQLKKMKVKNYYRIKLGVLKETIPKELFHNQLLSDEKANQFIYDGLVGSKPFFVGRLGSVELECLTHYLYFLDRTTLKLGEYPDNVKMMMNINAGFFPSEDNLLDDFCVLYEKGLGEMDFIWSMWFSKYEDKIYREYYKEKYIAEYNTTVFPIECKNPWTSALKGKKVLVIHPFDISIQENFRMKNELFSNDKFMPDFELITLRAVQSIANTKTNYDNWFDALKDMEHQIDKIDFDIALIGAGAYGLSLGAYVKQIGKKAIHVGGILQLFFGIKGKTWDKLNIYNEYWSSPKEEERPKEFKKVEDGRYW